MKRALIAVFLVAMMSGCLHVGTTTQTSDDNINDTSYEIKRQLIDRFDPGTTFGMPTIYTNETVDAVINNNSALAQRIRNDYNVTGKRDVFRRINQFQQVTLSDVGKHTYNFTIRDGDACVITTINGTYNTETNDVSFVTNSTKGVPC